MEDVPPPAESSTPPMDVTESAVDPLLFVSSLPGIALGDVSYCGKGNWLEEELGRGDP